MTRRLTVVRGIAIFAAVWQGVWILGDERLRAMIVGSPGEPAAFFLIAAMLAWLALWPSLFGPLRRDRRLRILQICSMAFVVGAGLALIAAGSADAADGWQAGASLVTLGAGLAGLYLTRRPGIAAVFGMVVAEILIVTFVYTRGGITWPLEVDLIYPFYALALGLAIVASRHALLRSASQRDATALLLRRQRYARAMNESTDASFTSAETRLHETVLNTLTAIVRGGLADDHHTRLRVSERARESAAVLAAVARGSDFTAPSNGDLTVDLTGVLVDLEQAGIELRLDGALDARALDVRTVDGPIDHATFAAVGSAVRECLLNVVRHAQASSAVVIGDVRRTHEGVWWRIRVRDDGRGFDPSTRGFGLSRVVEGTVTECGGRVSISSSGRSGYRSGRPSRWGTTVTIEVPLIEGSADTRRIDSGFLAAITIPVVTAFSAITAYTIVATWQYAISPVANGVAAAVFAVMVAVLIMTAMRHRSPQMPWWAVAVVLVGVPAMTHMGRLVHSVENPTGDWTYMAGAVLMFVIVATGPLWVAPAAVVSWVIAQETEWIVFTQSGMFAIVIAAVLGWQLRRSHIHARILDREAELEQSELDAMQTRLAIARRRYQDLDTSGLIELLEGIAAERIDPRDHDVRTRCAREERLIRSLLRLRPDEVAAHGDLAVLATVARDVDVDLSISVVDDLPSDASLSTLTQAAALLALARPGSRARASITRDDLGCMFRLVVEIDSARTQALPPTAELLDTRTGIVAIEEVCVLSSVDGANAPRSAHV